MEPEGSLPHSQVPATCPCPESARPVHTPTFHFQKIHLNIILPSMPGSPKRSLSLRFLHQNPIYIPLFSLIRTTCPAHLILLDFITRTILGEEYISLSNFLHSLVTPSLLGPNILKILLDFITRTILGEEYISLSSFLHSLVTPSLLGPNILNTIFSNFLSLRSSLNVGDQVSHPFKITYRIIILYILIFKFLDSKLEGKKFCTE